jgi:hypothetical protein
MRQENWQEVHLCPRPHDLDRQPVIVPSRSGQFIVSASVQYHHPARPLDPKRQEHASPGPKSKVEGKILFPDGSCLPIAGCPAPKPFPAYQHKALPPSHLPSSFPCAMRHARAQGCMGTKAPGQGTPSVAVARKRPDMGSPFRAAVFALCCCSVSIHCCTC